MRTTPASPGVGARTYLALGLAAAVLGTMAVYIREAPPLVGMDDANIGFRYARNLAEGHGFVFNPGGERVEGVTSLLWVGLQALLYRLGGPALLEPGSVVLSLLLAGLALGVVFRLLAPYGPAGRWTGVVWVASLVSFYHWTGLAMMDSALWTAALHLFFAACLRSVRGGGHRSVWLPVAAVAFMAVSRPDTTLVAPGGALAFVLAFGWRSATRRLVAAVVVATALAQGALTLGRWLYFGYPLPNTYYTKVPPDLLYRLGEGLRYVGGYFAAHPVSLVAVGASAWLGWRVWRAPRGHSATGAGAAPDEAARVALAAALFAGVGFGSAVVVGGDHFFDHRFLQPYLPLLALPLAWAASQVRWRVPRARSQEAAAVALTLAALFLVREWRTPLRSEIGVSGYEMALEGRLVGALLSEVLADDPPVVGVWQAGGIGYAYRGPVRDLLGLNWVAMGHAPGDRKGIRDHAAFHEPTFWADPPDLMVPVPLTLVERVGCPRRVWGGVLRGVMATPRFREAFEPVIVRTDDGDAVFAYGRSTWLDAAPRPVERPGWSFCHHVGRGGSPG